MAGEDSSSSAKRGRPRGSASASCTRSRSSIRTKTVLGNVEEGVAEIKALLTRYDEINAKLGEEMSPEEMDKVLEEQAKVQDRIEAANAWDLDSRLELAMDALRLPPGDADVTTLSGGERRRVALCRLLLQVARPAAARRADQPSRRRVGRLARALPQGLSRHRRRASRTIATSSTTSPAGSSSSIAARAFRGKATTRPGWSRSRTASRMEEKSREPAAADARARAGLDPHVAARAAGEGQGAPQRLRGPAQGRDARRRSSRSRSTSRPGPRLGDIVVEARDLRKGYGDMLLMDDVNFTLPRGGIVGVIGPNGAGKTTLFRMITGKEQPDGGTLRLGDTVQVGYVDQAREARSRRSRCSRRSPAAATIVELGKREVASRAYVSWFNFKGREPAAQGRAALRRRAQPRPPREAAQGGREPAAARRADQRSRRRHAARARRGAASTSPAAPSSSATTAGSSIASPRTSWRSKATARWSGSRATTRTTRPTGTAGWAPRPTSRTASSTES